VLPFEGLPVEALGFGFTGLLNPGFRNQTMTMMASSTHAAIIAHFHGKGEGGVRPGFGTMAVAIMTRSASNLPLACIRSPLLYAKSSRVSI
jgi:hypothetical protein